MIDFSLTKEQEGIIEKYRDFTDRFVIPARLKWDQLAEFPWEVVKSAYDEGIMNAPMDPQYGGHGHSLLDGALASEELGAGCVGIGICMTFFFFDGELPIVIQEREVLSVLGDGDGGHPS